MITLVDNPKQRNKRYHGSSYISWRIRSIGLRCGKTIENETKEQKGGFCGMLLGTLAASLFKNMVAGRAKISGQVVITAGEETELLTIFNAASSFN